MTALELRYLSGITLESYDKVVLVERRSARRRCVFDRPDARGAPALLVFVDDVRCAVTQLYVRMELDPNALAPGWRPNEHP